MTVTPNKGYLFLYRRKGESLVIGEGKNQSVLTIEAVNDGRVKIGIRTDKEVPVERLERLLQQEG